MDISVAASESPQQIYLLQLRDDYLMIYSALGLFLVYTYTHLFRTLFTKMRNDSSGKIDAVRVIQGNFNFISHFNNFLIFHRL